MTRLRGQIAVAALLAVTVVALAAFAVLRSTATSGTPLVRAAATPQAAATTFGTAYLRTLEGAGAVHLPLTTSAVRQSADSTVIPRADRAGTLALATIDLTGQTANRVNAVLVASDGHHSYPFGVAMVRISGGWVVSGLQAPDLAQILTPAPPKPATVPAAARGLAERLTHHAKLSFGQVQHGVLPIQDGKRVLLLHKVAGRWKLWLIQD
jgi:hypothetical protein